ncbi:MAG: hypothetical protein WDO19_25545 [Bacteroidota bacterium]
MRTENYEEKLKIFGDSENVIGVSINVPPMDNKSKKQKEEVQETDKDGLKNQDNPIK